MSNSVVKVSDSALNESLMLLVGEDGTVTPSKDVVDSYLSTKTGATDLQVMHINKSDDMSIEVSVDNMLYVPDAEPQSTTVAEPNFDEISYNLYNIRLDHDYTKSESLDEIDELAQTLSILDGDGDPSLLTAPKPDKHVEKLQEPVLSTVKEKVAPPLKSPKQAQKKVKREEGDEESTSNIESESEERLKTPKKIVIHKIEKIKSGLKVKLPTPVKVEKVEQSEKADKKLPKKEKKVVKNAPDDFALFSTPDIIRRVGGKEPSELGSPESKPAKVERSKSMNESPSASKKQSRLSLDGKQVKPEIKNKENKEKRTSTDSRKSVESSPTKKKEEVKALDASTDSVSQDDLSASNLRTLVDSSDLSGSGNEANISLDGNGLDLDPSLLENINNDLISEDILYQVAQSLVSNTELQNAIDKSLNEEGLGLQTAMQEVANEKQMAEEDNVHDEQETNSPQRGTQIVRPDGRIVVIPPIERPATRSRNRKQDERTPPFKFIRKPLDEEHVSGNELDSSGEEEESEDDPNKLWCICNQPHNNRFMICCDTCEEWYHGKCVNITKAMGQQMESEGREWICLFCKDPQLRRPQAAARRIRKASRNSRQSTESSGSTKAPEVKEVKGKSSSVPCVVCQKPSRSNSIFCSESCILAHAQGVERVVVFERSTGNMLTGNKAPSAANLEQWLKEHPGYEVVRSAGKIVTTKQTHNVNPSKLKLLKHPPEPPVHRKVVAVTKNVTAPAGIKLLQKTPSPKILNKPNPLKEKPSVSPAKPSTPTKIKTLQAQVKSSLSTKEKPTAAKIVKVHKPDHSPAPNRQENIRENVQKTIFEQLTNRMKMVDDLKLSEDELKDISTEIESQLYKCFGDTGQKYRNKYRSLIFNIKDVKNQTLWRRICEKTINPYQLVRLSPDDLASQELALWREREAKHQLDMIKKSELELLKCNRQYVLKTHKGEQILEDNRPTDAIDNTEVITSLTEGEKSDKKDEKKKHSHRDKEKKSKDKSHRSHRSSSRDRDRSRKRSRSRDRSKHGERRRSRSRDRDRERHKRSSHKSSRHKKDEHRGSSSEKLDKKSKEILEQLVDNKIVPPLEDRLWKHVPQEDVVQAPTAESDSDHEPTSTVTIPTPPRSSNDPDEPPPAQVTTEIKIEKAPEKETKEVVKEVTSPKAPIKSEEIWRGSINMVDVAQISITAHEVSGDCAGLSYELPKNLDIVGRISPDTVWEYIGKMKCSNSKVISVVRLNAINVEEKMPYLALYSYLSSRNRLGVVKSTNKAVKDFYILPLAAQKPIPQVLLPLSGPGFEEARPALLLGIIVRDKRKRPYIDSMPPAVSAKKTRTLPLVQHSSPTTRSYTPPPSKDPRVKLPLPPAEVEDQDGDEPYSPEDSDPDNAVAVATDGAANTDTEVNAFQTFQPFVNKFDDIPGLDNSLPSSTQELQREMEKLNKEIEMQKSEINSISQNIATASTEIGASALANIVLPSNLPQILDSIKTINSTADSFGVKPQESSLVQESSDFTIPLMLPTSFSRHSNSSENTIPLNLPKKKSQDAEKASGSVLSSLSEEDLIRKAEEMLEDTKSSKSENLPKFTNRLSTPQKTSKVEMSQPPIPGLEDDKI